MSESEIFNAVVKLPADERADYLARHCGPESLRHNVEELLRAHDATNDFLRSSASSPDSTRIGETHAEAPGTKVGPYKLLQKIGEGGMGIVYMAEQEQPVRRKVAVKIIKPGMDSKQVVARFEAERQALSMMDHPNIARVLDAGTTESGRPYFVMELVHGVPITEFCDSNKLSLRERLELFVPICQAIHHAHQKGIVHRDIKPSNILVTMYDDRPIPKVIDFGVAKAIEQRLTEKTLFTQFGMLVGTLEYMSPEQAEMNAFGVDTRSDVYSLGVLMYELLTGTTPIQRQQLKKAALAEFLRMIKEEEPPRPSVRLTTSATLAKTAEVRRTEPAKLSALVRGELDWIVMKCLEKDRARRYDSASGLARDVERFLRDEPVEACPPTLTYRLRKAYRRNKPAVLVAGAFVALLSGAAVLSAILAIRATRAESLAQAESRRALQREAEANEQRQTAERERRRAEVAEKSAREETAAAKAVRDFLIDDLLGHASWTRQAYATFLAGRGESVQFNPTIHDLLDRAAAGLGPSEIEARFPNLPGVQADLLRIVGESYFELQQREKGLELLTRALELYRSSGQQQSPGALGARHLVALAQMSEGKVKEVLPDLLGVHADCVRVLGEFDPLTIDVCNCVALANLHIGEQATAVSMLERHRARLEEHLGPDHAQTIGARYYLGMAWTRSGQLSKGIAELESIKQIDGEGRLSANHPYVATLDMALGWAYLQTGRKRDAIPLMKSALQNYEEFGSSAWHFRHELAWAMQGEGMTTEAIEVHRANLRFAKNPNDLLTWGAIGQCCVWNGNYDEAEQAFEEFRRLLTERNPDKPQSWELGLIRVFLGIADLKRARYEDAERKLIEGYKEMSAHASEMPSYDDGKLDMAKRFLAELYTQTGRPEEAQKWSAK